MSFIHADILVIGTGAAGIAAAVAGRRAGLKVVIADKALYPGGKATHAEVGTICGLYQIGRNIPSQYVVKGFAVEFSEALAALSESKPVSNHSGLHFLPYQTAAFEKLCMQYLNETGIQYLPGCEVVEVECSDRKINKLVFKNGGQNLFIQTKSVIDCSGMGVVSKMTGLPMLNTDKYMGAARVFRLGGIQVNSETGLNLLWIKALKMAVNENQLPDTFTQIHLIPGSFKNGEASFKIALPMEVTLNETNLSALKEIGELMVGKLVDYLKSSQSAFKDISLVKIAEETGIRVEKRPIGKYILTEMDILNAQTFSDAVAKGAWPIEIWDYNGEVSLKFMRENKPYDIPAGALQSNEFDNLYFAGRGISADDGAIASARVMGTCLQTGYAAGVLASHFSVNKSIESAILKIQKEQL